MKRFLWFIIVLLCFILVGCESKRTQLQSPDVNLPNIHREWAKPQTSDAPQNTNIAHQQLTQNAPFALQEQLREYMSNLKGMTTGETKISVKGARAVFTPDSSAPVAAAWERIHLHPSSDGSLHIALPNIERSTYIEALWRWEAHPRSPTTAMIYWPRSNDDLKAIKQIIYAVYLQHNVD